MVIIKYGEEILSDLDLVALTYVKCNKESVRDFMLEFNERFISIKKILCYDPTDGWKIKKRGAKEGIIPVFIVTTVGHFDFIISLLSSSTYLVTQFSMDILRYNKTRGEVGAGLGDKVRDTNTIVGVDAMWLIDTIDLK